MNEQARLRLWLCICAVFAFAALLASPVFVERWFSKKVRESSKTVGTYVLTGHPTVEVKMFGFLQGNTFQVCTDTKGKRAQIFSTIWSLPPNGGNSVESDSVFCEQMRQAKTISDGGMSYKVYWTQDGAKCAFALHSHLIAAFDIQSGAQIQYTGDDYDKFNARIRSFLSIQQRGDGATLDESRVPIGKWVERFGVEKGQTNASLSITATNFTVLVGTNQEVWTYYVPSTNRFEILACRNGITNVMFWGYGGACDRVIHLGNRRWYVNREQAATVPP